MALFRAYDNEHSAQQEYISKLSILPLEEIVYVRQRITQRL